MMFDQSFGSIMAQEIKEAPSIFRNCIRADGVSDDVIDRFINASAHA